MAHAINLFPPGAIAFPQGVTQETVQVISPGRDPRSYAILFDSDDSDAEASISYYLYHHLSPSDIVLIDTFQNWVEPIHPSLHPNTFRIAERIAQLGVRVFGYNAFIAQHVVTAFQQRDALKANQANILRALVQAPDDQKAVLCQEWKAAEQIIRQLDEQCRQSLTESPDLGIIHLSCTQALQLASAMVAPHNGKVFGIFETNTLEHDFLAEALRASGANVMESVGNFQNDLQIQTERHWHAALIN